MRILHAPVNSAGQATTISRAQRKLGHQSDVMIFQDDSWNYEHDYNLRFNKLPRVIREVAMLANFVRCLFKYDVFHFHCAVSLLPRFIDLPILKFFGKKTIMEYWGSDCVQLDIARKYTLWTEEELKAVYPKVDDEKQREKIAKIDSMVSTSMVGDYSLQPFVPQSIVVRQAVNIDKWPFIGAKADKNGEVTIVHAPTNRKIKGTEDILKVIDKLKADGYKFNFILVEKKPNNEAVEYYKKADIMIDEIRQGPYGSLAIECLSLGKPVICRRDAKLEKYYLDCPIVNADKDNLYEKLVELIKNPSLREELGQKGREFVEKTHKAEIIAKQLIEIYEKL